MKKFIWKHRYRQIRRQTCLSLLVPTNLTFQTRWGSRRLSGLNELILAHIWPNTDLVPSGPARPPLLRDRFTCRRPDRAECLSAPHLNWNWNLRKEEGEKLLQLSAEPSSCSSSYLDPVELHHRSVLPVPNHRGLNHLPERCLLVVDKQTGQTRSGQTGAARSVSTAPAQTVHTAAPAVGWNSWNSWSRHSWDNLVWDFSPLWTNWRICWSKATTLKTTVAVTANRLLINLF